jgi:DNA-binding transcriptional ArsR family regulator
MVKHMLNQSQLDRVYHALSASNRRAIVEHLQRGPQPVGALAEPLEISLAATVQHLQVLEDAGLVRTRKTGRVRTCQLVGERLAEAERWLHDRRATWERHFDRLAEFLGESPAATRTNKRKS